VLASCWHSRWCSCSPGRRCSSAAGRSPRVLQGMLAEQAAVLAQRCSRGLTHVLAQCNASAGEPVTLPPLGHRRAPCVTSVELRNDEPPFSQAARWYCAGKRCKHIFQMFQKCVTNVSHRCCKSTSGCYTCCNGYTRMFQV
jgi:hypothetical protein